MSIRGFGILGALLVFALASSVQYAEAHNFERVFPNTCCPFDTCDTRVFFEDCDARPGHPEERCREGHRAFACECEGFACGACACGLVPDCVPEIPAGSEEEVPDNGMDDDCDGVIDDEQCDGVDNDGDLLVDEDLGSCLFKILFVPMAWEGSEAEFVDEAQERLDVFLQALGLDDLIEGCPDNISADFLDPDVASQNIPATSCSQGCGVDEVSASVSSIPGINIGSFDVIVALTDDSICGLTAGCSNGSGTVWLETEDDDGEEHVAVLAHELGHILGLTDEYNARINGPPNELGEDLGCDPVEGASPFFCCNLCSGSDVCCAGNESGEGPGCFDCPIFGVCVAGPDPEHCPEPFNLSCEGRCIMSYADACGPRGYCERCSQQLTAPPADEARSEARPDGQAPMTCSFVHLGAQRIWGADVVLSESGKLNLVAASIATGRLGLGKKSSAGRYEIEVRRADETVLNSSAFDLRFEYRDPKLRDVDYSSLRYSEAIRGLRLIVPRDVEEDDRLPIIARKDGVLTWRTTFNGFPPTANAGADRVVECGQSGGASMMLDGTSSTDPDGDSLAYSWSAPGITFDDPSSATPTATFPLGTTTVSLVVNDGIADSPADTAELTVVDTTGPVVEVQFDPNSLWPPNHRLVDIQATVTATDICDPDPIPVVLESIVSDEADDAPGGGDGNTSDDIQDADFGSADFAFRLRAERHGAADGRTYTVTYSAADDAGNESSASASVQVPHDQGGVVEPVAVVLEQRVNGTVVRWTDVEGAQFYNVIRGLLSNIGIAGSVIDLGAVHCIEPGSLDASTEGFEDADLPTTGQIFFYLVGYDDGSPSSYGTESAGRPRVTASGDCP